MTSSPLRRSYTDTKMSFLPPGVSAGGPHFDRDGATSSDGAERRVDPADGCAYTRQEFLDFYTREGQQRWASAKPPTGAEDRRKLTAVLFLNERWWVAVSRPQTARGPLPRHMTALLVLNERWLVAVSPPDPNATPPT